MALLLVKSTTENLLHLLLTRCVVISAPALQGQRPTRIQLLWSLFVDEVVWMGGALLIVVIMPSTIQASRC